MNLIIQWVQSFSTVNISDATDGNWYSGQDIHGNNAITTDSNGSFDIQVNLDQTPDLGLVQWMMNCSEDPKLCNGL